MTNEQLTEYERLDNSVQKAQAIWIGSMMDIAATKCLPGEDVKDYCVRLEQALEAKNRCFEAVLVAKAKKTAFLRAV